MESDGILFRCCCNRFDEVVFCFPTTIKQARVTRSLFEEPKIGRIFRWGRAYCYYYIMEREMLSGFPYSAR